MDGSSSTPLDDAVVARRAAVVMAGHTGDATTAVGGLSDPAPSVRAAALGAAARTGELDDRRLATALADPDATVRRRAAELAATSGGAGSLPALVALLDDTDARVVEVAAFACGEHGAAGSDEVAPLARVATGHDDALCREAAVAAIGSLAGRERVGDGSTALDAVLAGCSDRAAVRRRAVLALAAFDDPEATEALRRATADRDLQVRQAAEELLAIDEGD